MSQVIHKNGDQYDNAIANLKIRMAETERAMARNIAATFYEPNAIGREILGKHRRARASRFAGWLADRLINLASWLKGYDVTEY